MGLVESTSHVANGPSPAEARPVTLTGSLDVLDIVFTVLAYNAPLTVVTGFMPLILSIGNGLGAPLTFVVAGALMLLFAVGFTTMSRHVPNAGAYYAYVTVGLGKRIGLGSALIAILAYLFMIVGMYLYAGVMYDSLSRNFFARPLTPWWKASLVLFLIVSVLGYFRITLSARLLTIALICEVVLVVAWEAAIAIVQGSQVVTPGWLTPGAATSGSVGTAILLGVTCFAGFEATAVFREEARDPDVTVPRATYISIVAMTVLFASAAYFYIVGYGPENALARSAADPSNATLNSVGQFLGRAGLDAVNILICSSIFACLLALHNILSRYIYSLSIDGIFPKSWSDVHPSHGSPYRASILVSAVTSVVLLLIILASVEPYAGYAALVGVGGYVLLALQILTSISVIVFFWRNRTTDSVWKTRYVPIISVIGLSVTGWLATSNLGLLTGNERVAWILIASIFATLTGGTLYATWLKRYRPSVYRAIGRQVV